MKKHQIILEQCSKLGFQLLPNQKINGGDGAFFLHIENQEVDVQKFLTIRYLSRTDKYSIMYGFNCPKLRDYYSNSKSIPISVAEAITQLNIDRPYCWHRTSLRFSCRQNSWAAPSGKEELEEIFSGELKVFFDINLLPIDSMQSLLAVYLRDDAPFEWRLGTSYFARICEIAFLVSYTKSTFESAIECFDQHYSGMQNRDLYGAELPKEFFVKLLDCINMDLLRNT
jgi:hypothetical protein